ncbi:hypothetical protein, partial [Xenorhabdus kozodoii]|uniref:hypothetical protein n=1 Tax=Xenorhabdus kozodoii TaxID=351676 RepID=UPI001ABEFBAD
PGRLFRVARLRILRVSPQESSVYFRFLPAVRRGLFQLVVGQWWRIIGSFSALTIVFLKIITNRSLLAQNPLIWCFYNLQKEKRGAKSTSSKLSTLSISLYCHNTIVF